MGRLSYLPNLGPQVDEFDFRRVKRLFFTLSHKEDNTLNSITTTNAALLSAWQALFELNSWVATVKTKVVPSPILYNTNAEQDDGSIYTNEDYETELAPGKYTIPFTIERADPYFAKQLNQYQNTSVAVYMVDEFGKVAGVKDGSTLYPLRCTVRAKNFMLEGYENTCKVVGTITFKDPSDLDKIRAYEVLDSSGDVIDVTNDTQIYSLTHLDVTVTSPAVTGCSFTVYSEIYSEALSGITYDEITFYNSGGSITLSDENSITDNGDGSYDVSEADLLTAGTTYQLRISLASDKYDHDQQAVAVPS